MLFVLIGFCRFVFALSLGAVECDSNESVPQQQIEQLHQGKQKAFDYYEIYTRGRLRLYLDIGTRINLIGLVMKKIWLK